MKNRKYGTPKFINSIGEHFRSRLEVQLSELFIKNNIKYDYEIPVLMNNNHYKIIDFVVNNILIEVTGYAYKSWQEDFNKKMLCLRESVDNQIIVLTYPENLSKIYTICSYDIYIGDINNNEKIISLINFCNNINKLKETFKEENKNVSIQTN